MAKKWSHDYETEKHLALPKPLFSRDYVNLKLLICSFFPNQLKSTSLVLWTMRKNYDLFKQGPWKTCHPSKKSFESPQTNCHHEGYLGQGQEYIYVYIHTYINTYIHSYIHTLIHTFIHKYIHTHIHTYIIQYAFKVKSTTLLAKEISHLL